MPRIFISLCLLILQTNLIGQLNSELFFTGNSVAMGLVNTTDYGVNAIQGNHSGMVGLNNFGAIISAEQRFGLKELNAFSLSLAKRIESYGVIGFTIGSFGIDALKQQTVALSYAKKLTAVWSLSAAFDLYRVDASEFGSSNYFSFQLGSQFRVTEQWTIGILIKNPFSTSVTETTDYSSIYSMGIRYQMDDKVNVYSQITKLRNSALDWRSGIDYAFHPRVNLRLGLSTSPTTLHFGFGVKLSESVNLDGGFYRHEALGISPAMSISFEQ